MEAFKQRLLVGHRGEGGVSSGKAASMHSSTMRQPGNPSSILDKDLAEAAVNKKMRWFQTVPQELGWGTDAGLLTLILSHGMVAGVATVPPTDLILLFPTGLPDPQTDSIDDEEEDYDDIGAA